MRSNAYIVALVLLPWAASESSVCAVLASSVFDYMRQARLTADVITCNAAISAFERSSAWRAALQLLAEMREHGPIPTLITYNAAMD